VDAVTNVTGVIDTGTLLFPAAASIPYTVLGVNPEIVSVVTAIWLVPTEDNATLKFPDVPVETTKLVPAGLVFSPNITVMLVVYTLYPTMLGAAAKVTVDAVTLVVFVDPVMLSDPASNP
jgi:hypothetical protein